MIRKIKENTWSFIILAISFLYLFTISLISEGLYGDTDSIAHYQIARYAFKYPSLLVSHWGKPLFTDLSAPFAQFGLQGSIFFNIVCGLLSAWLIYRIAKEFRYKYALLAIPFSLFAPVYMVDLFTSLTEVLFSLVLVAGIYFFLRQKNILSAVIISFIPYARTEGMMFLGKSNTNLVDSSVLTQAYMKTAKFIYTFDSNNRVSKTTVSGNTLITIASDISYEYY